MKPKDLVYPFRFENRRLLSKNNIFYIPEFLESYSDFDPKIPFDKPRVWVEFCSGNGEWIIDKCLKNPDVQFIAVEKNFARVQKIYSKRENLNISNLFIVSGDINLLIEHFFLEKSVDLISVNFPDPWPKDRHIKNRLFQKRFIELVERSLKPQGELILVTDDAPFSEWVTLGMSESNLRLVSEDLTTPIEGYGSSFFQRLFESKGKQILYHRYSKGSKCLI